MNKKTKAQNISHTTHFTIYPTECNYMEYEGKPMVHGGSMLLHMDRAAAECVRLLLKKSSCNESRTVGVNNVQFYKGANLGNLVKIECLVTQLGIKSIKVKTICYVIHPEQYQMASGEFTFCSFYDGIPFPHDLEL